MSTLRVESLELRELLSYSITDLGIGCDPMALNGPGQVAMLCHEAGTDVYTPIIWQDGFAKELGIPDGAVNAPPQGINDAGQVVGFANYPDGHTEAAFLGGKAYSLGMIGDLNSFAYAVNGAGQVAGVFTIYGEGSHGFTGDADGITDLGFLFRPTTALTDDGLVAGSLRNQPVLWQDGKVITLPLPVGGLNGGVNGLSADGHFATGSAGGNWDGGVNGHALLWIDGKVIDLHPGSPLSSGAVAVNDAGQVVGSAGGHAELWDDAGAHDLNGLIPPDADWRLQTTAGINNAGQIIGRGTGPDGQAHGYLLTPDAGPHWLGWALALAERR